MNKPTFCFTLAFAAALTSCAAPQTKRAAVSADFECKGRRAEYTVIGHMMYEEFGIRMSCENNRPKVVRFYTKLDATNHEEGAVIDEVPWEKRFEEIMGTGWRHLDDCQNPDANPKDPMYTFVISDGAKEKSFICQGSPLPYPYDGIKHSLDQASIEIHQH